MEAEAVKPSPARLIGLGALRKGESRALEQRPAAPSSARFARIAGLCAFPGCDKPLVTATCCAHHAQRLGLRGGARALARLAGN